MRTAQEIDSQIAVLNQMFADYIAYNDSVDVIGTNEEIYNTSTTLLQNTEVSNYSAIQELEEVRKNSLIEHKTILSNDTTLYNVCSDLYGQITEEIINSLIIANDLGTINRYDIDPNDPILKKDMVIVYYK